MAVIRELNHEQQFSSELDRLDRRLRETILTNGSDLDRLERRLGETISAHRSDAELSIRRGL